MGPEGLRGMLEGTPVRLHRCQDHFVVALPDFIHLPQSATSFCKRLQNTLSASRLSIGHRTAAYTTASLSEHSICL
eukprot:2785877-Amphidinium_carterae.1